MLEKVKEDGKRSGHAKMIAVIAVLLVLIAVWWRASTAGVSSGGASFGDVFQIDPGQLGSVQVYGNGKLTTYTQPAEMEAFVEHLRGFRYTESEHLLAIVEMIGGISFYDTSGHYIGGLGLGLNALLTEDNTLYKGDDETYFAPWFD